MSNLEPIMLDELDARVAAADKPVLVDLWAPWCGYCMRNMPIVEELAKEHADEVEVLGLNVDDNPTARETFGIATIPSYVLFAGGTQHVIRGSQTKKALLQAIADAS
ncbi:redoxin family protein [Nanchangia anserum]|uniref:Thioredoxin n=1 Tax=Nanchangia anserum TaxID=2692125 RepID=A0A8I0GC53_9ACTO|nr:thioredoxin domain-containing protein [Nanchangia anserum]MBD3689566.1 redoxin family protein [Nanchangia anserum]QOX81751.1 redoxin family protein [Nanchangia anserum]